MPRFYCPIPLHTGSTVLLPAGAARHVQVLRSQPGDTIALFNGGLAEQPHEGWCEAVITRMGRSEVEVEVGAWHAPLPAPAYRAHVLAVMPANERMDWLVEKATELGASSIQPLHSERSVLRLKGDRAEKKVAHWQAQAVSACEQSGRTRVPVLKPVLNLAEALAQLPAGGTRWLLSLAEGAQPLRARLAECAGQGEVYMLSGPEGGLRAAEEALALQHGFQAVSLGDYVLRAETASLVVLSALAL